MAAASSRSAVSARAVAASASARRFSSFYNRATVVTKEKKVKKTRTLVVSSILNWPGKKMHTRAFNGVALSTVFVLGPIFHSSQGSVRETVTAEIKRGAR